MIAISHQPTTIDTLIEDIDSLVHISQGYIDEFTDRLKKQRIIMMNQYPEIVRSLRNETTGGPPYAGGPLFGVSNLTAPTSGNFPIPGLTL